MNSLKENFPLSALDQQAISELLALSKEKDDPWLVACSGGADSIFLSHLLNAHFPNKISLIHFNHKIRASDSDKDELFVEKLAKNLDIPFISASNHPKNDLKSEEDARNARLSFFKQTYCQEKAAALIQGHHSHDVAESITMRITRGTNTIGLAAPRPIHYHKLDQNDIRSNMLILRPLLTLCPNEIKESLIENNIEWQEDETNENDDFFRNRVRHHIIPKLIEISPTNAIKGLNRTRNLLEEDEQALDIWAKKAYTQIETISKNSYSLTALINKPKAIIRRCLCKLLIENHLKTATKSQLVDPLINAIEKQSDLKFEFEGKTFSLSNSLFTFQDKQYLKPWASTSIDPNSPLTIFLPKSYKLSIETVDLDKTLKNRIFKGEFSPNSKVFLNLDSITSPQKLLIRQWEDGDHYNPLGSSGTTRLKNAFINRKVPMEDRKSLPIICDKETNKILWCPRLLIAESSKIRKDDSRALQLTFNTD